MTTKRGRKARGDLKVVPLRRKQLEPPPELRAAREREIWDQMIRGEPEGWFDTIGNQRLLAQYCRSEDRLGQFDSVIDQFQIEWIKSEKGAKRYIILMGQAEKMNRLSLAIATKLRLTNQSRYSHKRAGTIARNPDSYGDDGDAGALPSEY